MKGLIYNVMKHLKLFEDIDFIQDWDEEEFPDGDEKILKITSKFQLHSGDRVICDRVGEDTIEDKQGVVVGIYNDMFSIEFDEWIQGHDCNGDCKDGHGWFVFLGANNIRKIL